MWSARAVNEPNLHAGGIMTPNEINHVPSNSEPTRMELIASYVFPIAGAVGIAAYIVSQILD